MTDKEISAQCAALEKLLIAKHANYGNTAETRPALVPGITPGEAIFVRMSDKVARISALNTGQPDKVGESLADTVRDLAGYCILWLAIHDQLNEIRLSSPAEVRLKSNDPAACFDPADGNLCFKNKLDKD